MVTDTELASAIRSIGATGEPFSSAMLRAHLGITTDDRRVLTHFNAVLRSYCSENGASLERLGKNRYRLVECEVDDVVPEEDDLEIEGPPRVRQIVIRITRVPAEPEPRESWLGGLLARLSRTIGLSGQRGQRLPRLPSD